MFEGGGRRDLPPAGAGLRAASGCSPTDDVGVRASNERWFHVVLGHLGLLRWDLQCAGAWLRGFGLTGARGRPQHPFVSARRASLRCNHAHVLVGVPPRFLLRPSLPSPGFAVVEVADVGDCIRITVAYDALAIAEIDGDLATRTLAHAARLKQGEQLAARGGGGIVAPISPSHRAGPAPRLPLH